jgi:hypothetical protein
LRITALDDARKATDKPRPDQTASGEVGEA